MYEPRLMCEALYSLGLNVDYELKDLADDGLMVMPDDTTLTGLAEILTCELFGDMTLSDDWMLDYVDVNAICDPGEFVKPIVVKVSNTIDFEGCYHADTGAIEIARDCASVATIAHELIHLWIHRLRDFDMAYYEMVLIHLTDKIRASAPRAAASVFSLIECHAHSELENHGGEHGLMFALKSYDIDLRMGWELGRTFGYDGYAKMIGENDADD